MTSTLTVNWEVLEVEGIKDVAASAARRVSEQFKGTIEYDDAHQEALILLATDSKVEEYIDSEDLGLGALQNRLYQKLVHQVETEAKHRAGHVSRERLLEGFQE